MVSTSQFPKLLAPGILKTRTYLVGFGQDNEQLFGGSGGLQLKFLKGRERRR